MAYRALPCVTPVISDPNPPTPHSLLSSFLSLLTASQTHSLNLCTCFVSSLKCYSSRYLHGVGESPLSSLYCHLSVIPTAFYLKYLLTCSALSVTISSFVFVHSTYHSLSERHYDLVVKSKHFVVRQFEFECRFHH